METHHMKTTKLMALGLAAAVAFSSGSADRKSTRLNSSHITISYAVFCLKKKTIHLKQE